MGLTGNHSSNSVFYRHRLKDIPYFKTFSVPLCWAATVICAAEFANFRTMGKSSNLQLTICCFIFMYFHLFVWVNINDIRDIAADKTAHIKTIATELNFQNVCRMVHVANALLATFIIICVIYSIIPAFGICLIGNCLYSELYACIKFQKISRKTDK
jgi:4-hydroxybenzoate polyprenyltransferase